jgi:hypothetical protein
MPRPQPRHKQAKHKAPRVALVRRPVVLATLGTLAVAAVAGGGTAVALMGADEVPPAAAAGETTQATTSASSSSAPPLSDPAEVIDVGEIEKTHGIGSVRPDSWEKIPQSALAAYQRTAGVLAEADRKCHVEWTVLAGIGRVLSNHGERKGHTIDDEGVVSPAIVGKALRDRKGRKVEDTDAGQLDGDRRFDHPVGPMLLDPTTWSSVGVDGDNDGDRDPQDMDDAALSIAVLLCSGREDLRDPADLRSALERVNSDPSFVAAVVAIDAAYREDLKGEDPVVIEPDPSTVEDVESSRPAKTETPGDTRTPKGGSDTPSWNPPSSGPTEEPSTTDSGSPSPTSTGSSSTTDASASSSSATSSSVVPSSPTSSGLASLTSTP